MSASSDRQSDYISTARQATRDLWNAWLSLKGLQPEWNALNYSETLAEFAGANDGLAAADVGAVVFDTANAIETLFNTGHATNLAKLL